MHRIRGDPKLSQPRDYDHMAFLVVLASTKYRVGQVVVDLVWVDIGFGHSNTFPILLWQLEFGRKGCGTWQVPRPRAQPCRLSVVKRWRKYKARDSRRRRKSAARSSPRLALSFSSTVSQSA